MAYVNCNIKYKTILKTEEYKNGELSTDFLKRYGIIDRLTEDIKSDTIDKQTAAIAAAIIHGEYFKSKVTSGPDDNSQWKHNL